MSFKTVAIQAALAAGEHLLKNRHKYKSEHYSIKGQVTVAEDAITEELIKKIILKEFPSHSFFGEEGGRDTTESEYRWIIDPIDGTRCYVLGFNGFTVSIALERKGDVILGVVYFPATGELFIAEKGKGATLNGKKISVSGQTSLEKATGLCGEYPCHKVTRLKKVMSSLHETAQNIVYISEDNEAVHPVFGRGGIAGELCYVACGKLDCVAVFGQKPWDVAAGSLIAREAGAVAYNEKSEPADIYQGDYIVANIKLAKKIVTHLNIK